MSKVDEFLRHMRAGDLSDPELFALKAEAFDEMAAVERDELHRDTMRAIAVESRARAERRLGQATPDEDVWDEIDGSGGWDGGQGDHASD